MIVVKFGGTSVGTPQRMRKVAELVRGIQSRKIVVLSDLAGTSNSLVEISDTLMANDPATVQEKIDHLEKHYLSFVGELFLTEAYKAVGEEIVGRHFSLIRLLAAGRFDDRGKRELLAQGELISTELFYTHLGELGEEPRMLPALHFMTIGQDSEPELDKISERLMPLVKSLEKYPILITQGYICRNHLNEIDNLKRGGSDYTASLVGAAIRASEIQIWTDIDGMHNNDPRVVKNTFPIAELSFDEASELAYFGAKILHPSTILPAQKYGIPVRLKNTLDEEATGTLISTHSASGEIKAIAAKDHITAIKVKSSRMLLAYGFLRKLFEVFEKHHTSIDMISTSEVAVSVTIDDLHAMDEIKEALGKLGTIEVDTNLTIICVVGQGLAEKKEVLALIFSALAPIPIRMVSFGGSKNNISLLVEQGHKEKALHLLNDSLFTRPHKPAPTP